MYPRPVNRRQDDELEDQQYHQLIKIDCSWSRESLDITGHFCTHEGIHGHPWAYRGIHGHTEEYRGEKGQQGANRDTGANIGTYMSIQGNTV